MNTRLARLIAKIDELPSESVILDCYNQSVVKDVAITITTRIDANNYYLLEPIMQQPKITQKAGVMQLGNTTESSKRSNPNAGRVYDTEGIAPALNTCGGGNREPQILEPIGVMQLGNIADDSGRAFKNPERSRVYGAEGCCPTLKASMADRLVAEPIGVAMRGRGFPAQQQLEFGDNLAANCITSVQKDSLVAEPIPVKNATKQGYIDCPAGGCFDANYPNSEFRRGRVQENGTVAPTLTANGEPPWLNESRIVSYKQMPDGSIRGFNPNTPDKRGISEEQYASPDGVAGTLTTTHEPKVLEPDSWYYRIRKLHPVETYRLMDIDDADIAKLMEAKDGNGKPLLSKSAHYKLAGNSIVVACLAWLFDSLLFPAPVADGAQPRLAGLEF